MKFWIYKVEYVGISFASETSRGSFYEALKRERGGLLEKFTTKTDLSKLAGEIRKESMKWDKTVIFFRPPEGPHLEILEQGLSHRLCLPLTEEEIQKFWSASQ